MSRTVDSVKRQNPRTRRVQRVVLDSAIEVLLTEGAQAVNPSRVAAHADVARTTIYRHWPDQSSLLLATIDALTVPDHQLKSRGLLELDVRAGLEGLRKRLVSRDVRHVFGALAAHSASDEGFAAAQRRFIGHLRQPVRQIVEQARQRGEVSENTDPAFESSLLVGPLLYQHLVAHAVISDELIDDTVARWLSRVSQA